ncbi:MAG: signal peptidase I [Candidatus Poribacteria bacterium]|nr:signal peptidase I [Candidatus Poribacteria bacterium]
MQDAAFSVAPVSDRPTWLATTWEYTRTILIAFFIVFGFIRPFIFEIYKIPSGSMEDTLLVGDRVIVAKFTYGVRLPGLTRRLFDYYTPQRGDIIVFTGKQEPRTHFIKRCAAVPGDSVEVDGQRLIVNGHPVQNETFTKHLSGMPYAFPAFMSPLAPYYHEEPAIRDYIGQYNDRTPVEVQEAGGIPIAFLHQNGGEPIKVRVETRVPELTRRIPVHEYFIVKPDRFGNAVGEAILYQILDEHRWYLVTPKPYQRANAPNEFEPFVLPPDHYFGMGDNRERSMDSRFWGPIPFEMIKGKAVLVIWSTDAEKPVLRNVRLKRTAMIVKSEYGDFADASE